VSNLIWRHGKRHTYRCKSDEEIIQANSRSSRSHDQFQSQARHYRKDDDCRQHPRYGGDDASSISTGGSIDLQCSGEHGGVTYEQRGPPQKYTQDSSYPWVVRRRYIPLNASGSGSHLITAHEQRKHSQDRPIARPILDSGFYSCQQKSQSGMKQGSMSLSGPRTVEPWSHVWVRRLLGVRNGVLDGIRR
jgi:hypothetical protein